VHPSRCLGLILLALPLLQAPECRPPSTMTLNLDHTFFSRKGSWMTLIPADRSGTLRLFFARLKEEKGDLLDLTCLVRGQPRPMSLAARPSHLVLQAGGAAAPRARIYCAGPCDIVIDVVDMNMAMRTVKPSLDLSRARQLDKETWSVAWDDWFLRIELVQGAARAPANSEWILEARQGRLLVALRLYQGAAPAPLHPSPDRDIAGIDRDWDAWRQRLPSVSPQRLPMAQAAWWNLWSLYAPAGGEFATEAVLVAKAEMNSVWPWDHCFVALALGLADLQSAWDQLLLPFRNADPDGQLPDQMLPGDVYRGCSKPPIHGWTLLRLMERHPISDSLLRDFYPLLEAWNEFWFRKRDADGNGIPAYGGEHSGWDSGWDNATVFPDPRQSYEAPDLQAYLVLQMEALARVASKLGKGEEAATWSERARIHLRRLQAEFWNGRSFVVKAAGGSALDPDPTSLLPLMPLVLGERLDKEIFRVLADKLADRFLTAIGPASEDPLSPGYLSDGYWRGPVWAPAALLLADGLRRGGREGLAREIARRFADTVEHAGGHYENYDSLSGRGLRCRGFAWTSAVDLIFRHDFLR
jgi:putative isomerase